MEVSERLCITDGSFRKVTMAGDNHTAMILPRRKLKTHVIYINKNDGLLDGLANVEFVHVIAVTAEKAKLKVPFMLDAS